MLYNQCKRVQLFKDVCALTVLFSQ